MLFPWLSLAEAIARKHTGSHCATAEMTSDERWPWGKPHSSFTPLRQHSCRVRTLKYSGRAVGYRETIETRKPKKW